MSSAKRKKEPTARSTAPSASRIGSVVPATGLIYPSSPSGTNSSKPTSPLSDWLTRTAHVRRAERPVTPVTSPADTGYHLVIVADGAWPTVERYDSPATMARAVARYRGQPVAVVPCRDVLPIASIAGGGMYVLLDETQAVEVTSGRPNVVESSLFEPESFVPDFYVGPAAFRLAVDAPKKVSGPSEDDEPDVL